MNAVNLGKLNIPVIVPQKGVDYYTEQEVNEGKTEILSKVLEIIGPAEFDGQVKERNRELNELERKESETTRKSNENARISAEETRQSAEETRQASETSRETNEETRQTNETQRILNETQRISNEERREYDVNIIRQSQSAINTEINEINTSITNETTSRQNADNNLQSQITGLASGSPLVATSVAGMTDIDRVYVNTTDGHWYYYDGSTWSDGGVYQSVELDRKSIKNSQIAGNITDNNLLIGENLVDLALEIIENKKLSGYNNNTYKPNFTDESGYTTVVFSIDDIANISEAVAINLCGSECTYPVVMYTEGEKATNISRSNLISDYNYDENKNTYYLAIDTDYEKVAITFNYGEEIIIPVGEKSIFVSELQNLIVLNKNNVKSNIKITNILDLATTIVKNKRLGGYNNTTKLPILKNSPLNNVAIIKTSDIPIQLRDKILYYVNNHLTASNLIVAYTPYETATNMTYNNIIAHDNYDSNTNYFKLNTTVLSKEYLAICYYQKEENYILYSDLWAEGNKNYDTINTEENEISIILPSRLYGIKNGDYMIYYNNVIKNGIASKFHLVNIDNASNLDNFANITHGSVGTVEHYFNIFKKDTKRIDIKKSFEFITTNTNAGANQTKNVLFIGDSLTANGKYINKLGALLNGDDLNINFLGTQGTEPYNHEGRNGWRAYTYVTCETGSDDIATLSGTNPFYNPTENEFDFDYYITNNNISEPDYVFICLGTNDISRGNHDSESDIIYYYNKIIDSIKEHNSNIKIVLWLPPIKGSLNDKDTISRDNKIFEMQEYLIKNFDNKTNENIFLVPAGLFINSKTDYYTQNTTICGEEITKVNDTTHPKDSGYIKIAYPIYYIIKYLASI